MRVNVRRLMPASAATSSRRAASEGVSNRARQTRARRASAGSGACRESTGIDAISATSNCISLPARPSSSYSGGRSTAASSRCCNSAETAYTRQCSGSATASAASAERKALSIVTGPRMVISCARPAGTQQARRGGTSQRPCGVATLMVPRAANANCPRRWAWRGNVNSAA
ncbi:hypothetical protein D3C72_1354000 [compost metagenome]